MLETPPVASDTPSAPDVPRSASAQAWFALAHRRIAEAAAGLERWRRDAVQDFDPHAALKLRAHARRFERFAATFSGELEESPHRAEILSLAALASEIAIATAPLRAHDLCTDYFDKVQQGLGETTAAEASGVYSDWLWKAGRGAVIDRTEAALRALSLRPATRLRKALSLAAPFTEETPPLAEAIERVRAAGRAAWQALQPLVLRFDQGALPSARAEVRALRYAWKALRPCFDAETYTLNHDHAHRLQSVLGLAGDIELWVCAAEGFADHPVARSKGVRPQDWDRVLRYAWAQRLNLLHQVGRHALVRHWLQRDGLRADMVRPARPDLRG